MSDRPESTVQQRGVYLMADTPLSAFPLALEDGSGDKNLLAEVLAETLTDEEIGELVTELESARGLDGTTIVCEECGHRRPTTEENPTLVSCQSCGSYDLRYDR